MEVNVLIKFLELHPLFLNLIFDTYKDALLNPYDYYKLSFCEQVAKQACRKIGVLRIGRSGGWRYSARLVALAPDWEPEKISPHSWITIGGKRCKAILRTLCQSPFTIIGNQNANKLLQAHTLCVECNLNLLE